ncbi:putative short chain dehydrogenase/ reductase [Hypoxylon sp. FL0543]|nr:putative short chain dehydrogenase/ reductase [Hypoxylon sp. FL0543]
MPPIKDQNILVIGGSSGIGAAVAKLAAAEGANVYIASSNKARVDAAVKKIQDAVPNARIQGYVCDVNHDDVESSLEKLFADVTADAGQSLDHIVYTANSLNVRPVSAVSVSYLRENVQFGYVVPFIIAKLAPRYVKQSYTSSLIFTSGIVAERPMKGGAVVSGLASAIFGTVRGLALDLLPIRTNVVSPGAVKTEMLGKGEQLEQAAAVLAKSCLLRKIGTPEEVAEAYIYLMKDTNTTGSCVSTNGGALIRDIELS